MNLEIDRLVSSGLFDFDKYTYHVLQEKARNNFWGSLLRMEPESTRYWISRVSKGPYVEKRDLLLLCLSYSWGSEKWTPKFCEPCEIEDDCKVLYWYESQTPIDILQRVRAKSDVESLPESTILSSDDL